VQPRKARHVGFVVPVRRVDRLVRVDTQEREHVPQHRSGVAAERVVQVHPYLLAREVVEEAPQVHAAPAAVQGEGIAIHRGPAVAPGSFASRNQARNSRRGFRRRLIRYHENRRSAEWRSTKIKRASGSVDRMAAAALGSQK
jgi:hypothetical protein